MSRGSILGLTGLLLLIIGGMVGLLTITAVRLGAVVPTEGQIAYQSNRDGNFEIYLADVARGWEFNLTQHPADDMMPAWSPDGEKLAFVSFRAGEQEQEIYLLSMTTGEIQRLTTHLGSDFGPVWSPDGNFIVYESFDEQRKVLAILDVNTGARRMVMPEHSSYARHPVWSPDSQTIAFYGDDRRDPELFLLRVGERTPVRLTQNIVNDRNPVWSPDGEWLAFYANYDANQDVYGLHLDSGLLVRFTFSLSIDDLPAWSPSGDYLAFVSEQTGQPEIHLLALDCALPSGAPDSLLPVSSDEILAGGSDCERSVAPLDSTDSLVWSADGRRLTFTAPLPHGLEIFTLDVACALAGGGDCLRQLTDNNALDRFPAWRP
jgi:TolB protein